MASAPRRKALWASYIAALLFPSATHAQDTRTAAPRIAPLNELDALVVQDQRIAIPFAQQSRNIQILTRADILRLPVKSINEALQYLAGVDIRQRGPWGSQADVSLDGSTFDQVVILINGVRMSDPQTGHHMANLPIPLTAVERVEVLHGAAARVYGVNALAGAINIVTAIPAKNGLDAQAWAGSSFTQDTANGETYYGAGAQASASYTKGRVAQLISGSHTWGSGYRYNTGFAATSVFYQNKTRLGKITTLDAQGGFIHNQFGASLYYAAPYDKEATETVQTATGALGLRITPNAGLTITPRISYRYNHDLYTYIRQRPEVYQNRHETNVITGEVQGSYRIGDATTLGAGVEYRHEAINSSNLGVADRANLGVSVEARHRFGERTTLGGYRFGGRATLGGGVYVNSNSVWGTQAYPGIDGALFLTPRIKVFANAGAGQRLPTYTDLYYKGPGNIGNPDLKPESARYAEAGVGYARGDLRVQASYLMRRTDNMIDWVRDSAAAPWQPRNLLDVTTTGISARLDANAGELIHPPPGLAATLSFSYTYLDASLALSPELTTRYASSILRHQFVARANISYKGFVLTPAARYCYRTTGQEYTLVDCRVGYQLRKVQLYAEGTNLLDRAYLEAGAVPMPGRWLAAGVMVNGR